MTATRLVFVPAVGDASSPEPGTTCVVLDTTWTPGPGERHDAVPLRRLAGEALRAADLFEEALGRLDDWARDARMVDLLAIDGVTYWYRLREIAWHWLHERLIWERVIAAAAEGAAADGAGSAGVASAAGPSALSSIVLPAHETALLDVAVAVGRARGVDLVAPSALPAVAADAAPSAARVATATAVPGGPGVRLAGAGRLDIGRLAGRVRRLVGDSSGRPPDVVRADVLADRLRALAADPPGPILVLTNTRLQQRIGDPGARRVEDPNLGPVIAQLRRIGLDPVVIGLGLDETRDADWPTIASDPRLLPQSVLRRWRGPEASASQAADLVRERVRSAAAVPLDVHGADLAPALTAWLAEQAASIVGTILRQLPRIDGLVTTLRPRAIVLTHEAIQTPWLQVARARSVPTFAVQHGMIYPTHPGYRHPRDPRLLLPDATFVTGPFERDALLGHGGYAPDEVVVVGSPRLEMDDPSAAGPLGEAEREAVRREMGVAEGDRMLVVSTGFLPLQRRFVLAVSLERLFGRPVPGVHVVFKQHPGESDEGPYRELLVGLAAAGDFAPPPITVIRDVDLYRLLRAADAHLGLLSTVLTDAVAARTPNLIAVDQAHTDLLGYVAAGVARPIRDGGDLRAALGDLRPPDEGARRAFFATHLEPGVASERIVAYVASALAAPNVSSAPDRGAAPGVIVLRPARPEDAQRLFDWANDPDTRAASFDRASISWAEHVAWLAAVLADPDRRLWIAEEAGIAVGQLRVDRTPDGAGTVSIGLAPGARGRGLGRTVLRAGLAAAVRELGIGRARAVVMPANRPSRRLFEGAGFVAVDGAVATAGTEAGAAPGAAPTGATPGADQPGRRAALVLEADLAPDAPTGADPGAGR